LELRRAAHWGPEKLYAALLFAIGAAVGMAAGPTVSLIGRVWLEAVNYLQHVGIVRGAGEPVGRRHVWNHLSPLTRIAGYEITNHSDHHRTPKSRTSRWCRA
jgi:p-cymene methyl-monooxygenase